MPSVFVTRSTEALAFIAIALWALTWFVIFRDWNLEDGYIIYRIVQNLLAGNGWSFNAGEVHNASTSVLNTVLTALCAWSAGGDIPFAAHILGALWLLGIGAIIYVATVDNFGATFSALLAILLVALLAHSATWGLEVFLFIFLMCVACFALERGKPVWGWLAMCVLARPDGLLFAGLVWGALFLRNIRQPWSDRLSVRGLLLFAAILLPWTLYSLWQFGQLFPDTLQSKMWQGDSGFWGKGWVYGKGFIMHALSNSNLLSVPWLLVYGLGACGSIRLVMRESMWSLAILFAILQQCVYLVLNVPAYHWYFVPFDFWMTLSAALLLIEGAFIVAAYFRDASGISAARVRVLNFLLLIGITTWSISQFQAAPSHKISDSGNRHYLAAAALIEQHPEVQGAVAAVEVGTLGFYTNRPILDLIGLTTPNPEYLTRKNLDRFYATPPGFLVVHEPLWPMEKAVTKDPRFSRVFADSMLVEVPYIPLRVYLARPTGGQ